MNDDQIKELISRAEKQAFFLGDITANINDVLNTLHPKDNPDAFHKIQFIYDKLWLHASQFYYPEANQPPMRPKSNHAANLKRAARHLHAAEKSEPIFEFKTDKTDKTDETERTPAQKRAIDALKDMQDKLNPKDANHEVMEELKIPRKVAELPFGSKYVQSRITGTLERQGIKQVSQLVNLTKLDLLKIPNISKKSIDHIKNGLNAFGLTIRDDNGSLQ